MCFNDDKQKNMATFLRKAYTYVDKEKVEFRFPVDGDVVEIDTEITKVRLGIEQTVDVGSW